jgi:hypothetical protein
MTRKTQKNARFFTATIPLLLALNASAADTVSLGAIRIAVQERALFVPAHTVLDSGILEYLAVAPSGKAYESVMVLECNPKDFHAALLLINAKPGAIVASEQAADSIKVLGDTLSCEIIYTEKAKTRTIPALDLIFARGLDAQTEKELKRGIRWVFNGSRTIDVNGSGKIVHESIVTGSLIGLFIDPAAEINISTFTQTPYRGAEAGFTVNTNIVRGLGANYLLKIKRMSIR